MSSGNGGWPQQCFPRVVYVWTRRRKKKVTINHFHDSLAHAHSSVLKSTNQQHGIQIVSELAPFTGCSMAKGIRSLTPHHTTSRAAAPMCIDTAGPFQESLGGSWYVVMVVGALHAYSPRTGSGTRAHPPFSVW